MYNVPLEGGYIRQSGAPILIVLYLVDPVYKETVDRQVLNFSPDGTFSLLFCEDCFLLIFYIKKINAVLFLRSTCFQLSSSGFCFCAPVLTV